MKRPRAQAPQSASVDLIVLRECVEQFSTKTVILLGDFVADEFQYGEISRVSREAPVLILKHRETHIVPGGGANAANNLVSLGARVLPVTAVGDDAAGDALIAHFRRQRVNVSGIFRVKGWTTPTKSRFLAGWAHTVGQQVLRVDYEPKTPLPDAIRKKIHQRLAAYLRKAHALAVSDYGFGVATPELIQQAAAKRKGSLHVTLDARYGLHRYAKAGITSATPNEAEVEAEHHTAIGQNIGELVRAGRATLSEMKLQSLLVTRGRHGAALFEPGDRFAQVPVHGSDQAVDVTGAGDTVLAAYTLALTCGASPLEAAHIANIAGGLAVMKRGTATISREELLNAIRREASGVAS
jgi:D-glycero-beta-D-manno-heptose-7-phosphate kinase